MSPHPRARLPLPRHGEQLPSAARGRRGCTQRLVPTGSSVGKARGGSGGFCRGEGHQCCGRAAGVGPLPPARPEQRFPLQGFPSLPSLQSWNRTARATQRHRGVPGLRGVGRGVATQHWPPSPASCHCSELRRSNNNKLF